MSHWILWRRYLLSRLIMNLARKLSYKKPAKAGESISACCNPLTIWWHFYHNWSRDRFAFQLVNFVSLLPFVYPNQHWLSYSHSRTREGYINLSLWRRYGRVFHWNTQLSFWCQLHEHERIILLHMSKGILWRWSIVWRYQICLLTTTNKVAVRSSSCGISKFQHVLYHHKQERLRRYCMPSLRCFYARHKY